MKGWISIYDATSNDGEPLRVALNHVCQTREQALSKTHIVVDKLGGSEMARRIAVIEIEYEEGQGLEV